MPIGSSTPTPGRGEVVTEVEARKPMEGADADAMDVENDERLEKKDVRGAEAVWE